MPNNLTKYYAAYRAMFFYIGSIIVGHHKYVFSMLSTNKKFYILLIIPAFPLTIYFQKLTYGIIFLQFYITQSLIAFIIGQLSSKISKLTIVFKISFIISFNIFFAIYLF